MEHSFVSLSVVLEVELVLLELVPEQATKKKVKMPKQKKRKAGLFWEWNEGGRGDCTGG